MIALKKYNLKKKLTQKIFYIKIKPFFNISLISISTLKTHIICW